MLALADAGFRLLVPFGENTRYDLVVDDNERLLRVQCKTGRLRNGAVFFATSSTYGHHKNVTQRRRQYFGEIDVFGVYCAATGGVYVVPIDAVPVRCHAALRVDEPLNNQRRRIRFAEDFLIASISVSRLVATGDPEALGEGA